MVRALAHEQFARLLLTNNEELELTPAVLPMESEVTISDAEEESIEFISGLSASSVQDIVYPPLTAVEQLENGGCLQHFEQEHSAEMSFGQTISSPGMVGMVEVSDTTVAHENIPGVGDNNFVVSNLPGSSDDVVQTVADPLSSKLAAIHHVSQAIKSLRWTRQLQTTRPELDFESKVQDDLPSSVDFSVCACGDSDCIEVCDIREWLPTSKIDDKLWKLVLLLGESYLALGDAYKDDGQLYQALKVVELACLVYGSMPQDTRFISSMVCNSIAHVEVKGRSESAKSSIRDDLFTFDGLSSNYLFWAKAWTLVGDVFVQFYLTDSDLSRQRERTQPIKDLKMSSEVLKEVVRLKKKMRRFNKNCSSCSLINCSCRSDRASSGSSASSSCRDAYSSSYGRKQSRKSYGRNSPHMHTGHYDDDVSQKANLRNTYGVEHMKCDTNDIKNQTCKISDAMQAMNLADVRSERADDSIETDDASIMDEIPSETTSEGKAAGKSGGIFKYLRDSVAGDADYNLSVAQSCYEEAQKAMDGLPASSVEMQSVLKKKGWVCNELGRNRLEMKDLSKAEAAFVKAIDAFRQVEDHTNVILINCNLGHGRRALAEDMVPKIESLKKHTLFQNAYIQALEAAKLQYSEALRFYGAAKTELNALVEDTGPISSSLKNEVNTQYAHTYLKLGMLLARENTAAEVYENGVLENRSSSRPIQTHRKHEISANDAIREALAVYESLGECRKQEVAYAYFQLACYQRDCCLRFLESDQKKNNSAKGENNGSQKVKQYASLAERNWQKSIDFYGPKTHPVMYLTILMDRSALAFTLSSYLRSNLVCFICLSRSLALRVGWS